MKTPVWTPSMEHIRQSHMWLFMEYVNKEFKQTLDNYHSLHQWSINNKEDFWKAVWFFCKVKFSSSPQNILEKTNGFPGYNWFGGAKFNFAENLLKQSTTLTEKPAIIFRGEDQVKLRITRGELYIRVAQLASALRNCGIKPGDRVAGLMPNLPETIIAMLASTSIGAVWSSCSPDFGVSGVLDRFGQIEPKILFCADGYFFKGKTISSLQTINAVTEQIRSLKKVIVVPYVSTTPAISHIPNAILLNEFESVDSANDIVFEQLPFDHPLYIMYSSGTTGKPKCIVHGAGGTLLQHLKEHVLHTDIDENDRVFYFTTCGWMMWNWLVSSLATGATIMLYDGNPLYPNADSLFEYANQEGITVFGTSAKFLSAVEKAGAIPNARYSLPHLRTILSTGSPLQPESYDFVKNKIKVDVQLASISGGTDIISCFALGNPLLPVYRGELQSPGLGMDIVVLDENGASVTKQKGELCCKLPFPSMPIYFWNDDDNKKYRSAYFETFPDIWAHGDYAEITEHQGLVIYGRSDAILNPGGVRIGTAEIYRQVEKLPQIAESIAVGQEWNSDVRIILFVKLQKNTVLDEDLKSTIKKSIRESTTPRHVPSKIIEVDDIPRTISGKIVELAVCNVIHNRPVKNTDALANPQALDAFRNIAELQEP